MHMLLPKSPLPCKLHLDEFNKMVCLRIPSVSYLRTCNKISSSSVVTSLSLDSSTLTIRPRNVHCGFCLPGCSSCSQPQKSYHQKLEKKEKLNIQLYKVLSSCLKQ